MVSAPQEKLKEMPQGSRRGSRAVACSALSLRQLGISGYKKATAPLVKEAGSWS